MVIMTCIGVPPWIVLITVKELLNYGRQNIQIFGCGSGCIAVDLSPLMMCLLSWWKLLIRSGGRGQCPDFYLIWRVVEGVLKSFLGQSETNFDLHLLTQMPGGIVDEETTCATAAWGGLTDSLLVQLNYSTHTRSSFTYYSSFSSSRDRNNETRKFLSTTPLHFFYTLSVHGQNIQHSSTALQKCFSSLPLTGLPQRRVAA